MPVFRDLDFSVFKNQNLWGEKLKAQFRIEMFNILNNTNLTANLQTIFDGTGKLVTTVGTPVAPTVNTPVKSSWECEFCSDLERLPSGDEHKTARAPLQ